MNISYEEFNELNKSFETLSFTDKQSAYKKLEDIFTSCYYPTHYWLPSKVKNKFSKDEQKILFDFAMNKTPIYCMEKYKFNTGAYYSIKVKNEMYKIKINNDKVTDLYLQCVDEIKLISNYKNIEEQNEVEELITYYKEYSSENFNMLRKDALKEILVDKIVEISKVKELYFDILNYILRHNEFLGIKYDRYDDDYDGLVLQLKPDAKIVINYEYEDDDDEYIINNFMFLDKEKDKEIIKQNMNECLEKLLNLLYKFSLFFNKVNNTEEFKNEE